MPVWHCSSLIKQLHLSDFHPTAPVSVNIAVGFKTKGLQCSSHTLFSYLSIWEFTQGTLHALANAHSPSQAPGGPPHVHRLGLWSTCRFRSKERRIRASSRSCSLRSKTGKKRDSLTELSLRRREDGDKAGCSMATTSPIRLRLSLPVLPSCMCVSKTTRALPSVSASLYPSPSLALSDSLFVSLSSQVTVCLRERIARRRRELPYITPPTPSPLSSWHTRTEYYNDTGCISENKEAYLYFPWNSLSIYPTSLHFL